MTAGVEVVCGEVARKVDIEVNSSVLSGGGSVDCGVGGGGSGNGGNLSGGGGGGTVDCGVGSGGGLECVVVNDGVEVSDGGTGDVSVEEVGRFKEEELGLENEEVVVVDPLVSESDVNIENGSVVESPVVLVSNGVDVDVNGHGEKISGEHDADVESTEEVDGLTESTQDTVASSQVTVSELEAAVNVDEVDQFKKEELGLENEGIAADPLVSESNGIVLESTKESVAEVKAAKDDVNLVNGSTVDLPVVLVTDAVDVNVDGHLDKISGEQDADLKSSEEVDRLTESTQKTIESSEVTVSELEGATKLSDVTVRAADYDAMVNDGPESIIKLVDNSECQATVDDSGKTSEDLQFQVTDDGSESSGSLIEGPKGKATVDVSESCESPIKEQECMVSVDGSDSIACFVDNQECPVSVDEPESDTIVMELDGKLEEQQKLLVFTSVANVEVEPNHACNVIQTENQKAEDTEIRSGLELEENQDSGLVLTEEVDALANGQVDKFDRILEAKEQVKVEDEIQESQTVVIDNVQDELNLEDNTAESANVAEVSLEAETNTEAVIHENTSSEYGVSNCIDKPQEGLQLEASAENVETTSKLLVEKDGDSLSNSDALTVAEQKVEILSHVDTEVKSSEGVDCGSGIENVDASDDNETEVKDCETPVENVVVFDNEEKGTEVKDASVGDHSTLTFSDTIVNHGVVIEFGSIGRHESKPSIQNKEVENMNGIQSDKISNSSIEGEVVNDAIDAQNDEIEVLEYNFLVKIPRFEDENLREQIRSAHALVVEKTRLRDSIRFVGQEKRERLKVYNQEFEAAKQKEIAARRVVKAKRQEIEAVQAVINRWKNAMSVEDIDSRIYGVEYMIQHEIIQLKDEKEFIREIRQLKSLRDQLASNMGTPEEIRHAIDTKDYNEKRLKVLRKELEDLKAEVSKVVAVLTKIVKKYEELSREERELQCRFKAADEFRQKAYAHLNSLRKLSYDKNTNFRQFKGDLTTARTYLSQGDQDALHRLCANQVETFMEQWNNNDEFRQEYIRRCNCIASRKQKALDGAPPVSVDVAPVLPSNVIEHVNMSPVSLPAEVKHVAVVLPVEQEKDVSVLPTENKNVYNNENAYNNETRKPVENKSGPKKQELKNKSVIKPTNLGSADVAKEEAEVTENVPTKEEIELARKAEELKKEEAAKLKEQRRMEEKAKAVEALERKKRNAQKAQLRAELRARKEAEHKEKEREKRLRKKEKKTDGSSNGEEAPGSENEATAKEIEAAAIKKKGKKPAAHFFSRQLKPKPAPVPPQVLNRNRRWWQQAGHVALAALAVLVVFMMVNFGLFLGSKPTKLNHMRF
ncbi:uncharacterized protein LOC143540809 isoform X2 [Bidens hawaiensis]|uniref:uncharacterized protein LOC143540809 isoform X2 n=1 Tax=Bidens hawaiensis TaxID=980011 RepID=UPI00404B7B14